MKKIQSYLVILACSCSIILCGCNDTITQVGISIQPEEDKITIYSDTFQMTLSPVKADSIYAKTHNAYLGDIYDPVYGQIKADYLNQFYCEEDFQFYYTPQDGIIDSVTYYIVFSTWNNDPFNPMQISIYPVNKSLDKVFYTNINPEDYCDMSKPLASKAFSIYNCPIIDSVAVAQISSTEYSYKYYRQLKVRLPLEFGQRIYDETINNPSSFHNQESFNQFLPGFYITTDYGSGTLLHVDQKGFYIDYHYTVLSSEETDSVIPVSQVFLSTKDVIQMNHFQNIGVEPLLNDNDDYVYLQTPAAVFARLTIPAADILKLTEDRIVNNFTLDIRFMPSEDATYALSPPPYLLLLPEDSLHSFFENEYVEDYVTSYISTDGSHPQVTSAGYNAYSRTYTFYNMSNLLAMQYLTAPDEDLRMILVPVNREVRSSSSSYYSSSTSYSTSAISHYLPPSGVKLRKDKEEYLKVVVLSSKYSK